MLSPSDVGLTLFAIAALPLAYILRLWFQPAYKEKRYSKLPPGPKPHWLYGNELPALYPWRYFETLTQQYKGEKDSGLITIWKGREPMVVVGRVRPALELLEKRAAVTADRPRQIAGNALAKGMRILLVGYGDHWRKLRKALHSYLQPAVAKTYEPLQSKASKKLLEDIIGDPAGHKGHLRTYAASVVMSLAYGHKEPVHYQDPEIQAIELDGHRIGLTLRPGAWKVESLPFLQYVPGYMRTLEQWHKEELALFMGQMTNARYKLSHGAANECFTGFMTEKQHELELSDPEVAYLAGSLFTAGSDTSASAIDIAIMAAATYPDVQRRVQEELDRVVGPDRLPDFADRADLPLVTAFIRETYRWRPVSTGGFQHKTTEEIAYMGYVIPAGTIILGNHFSIHLDPEYYPDPHKFDIDRWLVRDEGDEGGYVLNENVKHFQFGFGRRVCPGQHIADRSLFINVARLLWAFRIEHPVGRPIDTLAFTNAANSHPLHYDVSFAPRSAYLSELISSDTA